MDIQPAGSALVNAYLAKTTIGSAVPVEVMRVAFEEMDRYRDYFADAPAMPLRFEAYA